MAPKTAEAKVMSRDQLKALLDILTEHGVHSFEGLGVRIEFEAFSGRPFSRAVDQDRVDREQTPPA